MAGQLLETKMKILYIRNQELFNQRKFRIAFNLAKPTLKALFCLIILILLIGLAGHQEFNTLVQMK